MYASYEPHLERHGTIPSNRFVGVIDVRTGVRGDMSQRGAEGLGLGSGVDAEPRQVPFQKSDPLGEPSRRQDPPQDQWADRLADEPRDPPWETSYEALERSTKWF